MDFFTISGYIVRASEYSDCLPIGIFIFFSFRIPQYKWVFIYLITFQALHFTSIYTGIQGENNMWVYKLIGLVELISISLWYLSRRSTTTLKFFFALVIIVYLILSYYFSPAGSINSLGLSLSTLFLISLSLAYFFWLYETKENVDLLLFFPFWVNSAFLIYLSSSFFAYLFSYEALFNTPDVSNLLRYSWVLHSMGNIVKCVILSVGLIVCKKSFAASSDSV